MMLIIIQWIDHRPETTQILSDNDDKPRWFTNREEAEKYIKNITKIDDIIIYDMKLGVYLESKNNNVEYKRPYCK